MKVFYSDHYPYPLPPGHQFPAEKYARLRFELIDQNVLQEDELYQSPPASGDQIMLAHSRDYYENMCSGNIDAGKLRQLGLPWSRELVVRTHRSIGGVIEASEEALQSGISGALSGGTHHAFKDEGRGFCVFNDTAVAILYLLNQKKITRCAIVDLDAHQGNGSAALLGHLNQVFILDMHGKNSYPVRKIPTTLDIALPDYVNDQEYLQLLNDALKRVVNFRPEIVFYIAGVDPLDKDRFGKLALTMQGLMERDRLVLQACKQYEIPIIMSMGGGYAQPIDLTIQAHSNTYRAAKMIFG